MEINGDIYMYTYLVHLGREVFEIMDGFMAVDDVDGGFVGLPVTGNHENIFGFLR